MGLKAAGGASWLVGAGVKSQVTAMAGTFMLGDKPKEILATLRKLHDQGLAFTVDILGETVVSEAEADHYAKRYLDLMDAIGPNRQMASHLQEQPIPGGPHPAAEPVRQTLRALFPGPPGRSRTAIERSAAACAPSFAAPRNLGRSSTSTWRAMA